MSELNFGEAGPVDRDVTAGPVDRDVTAGPVDRDITAGPLPSGGAWREDEVNGAESAPGQENPPGGIEKLRAWLATFPLISEVHVDYTAEMPGSAGIFPQGEKEVARESDIMGGVCVTMQRVWSLCAVMSKPFLNDGAALQNAEWLADFEKWVQEQSACGLAPTFGGENAEGETMRAENGRFTSMRDDGAAAYTVTLTATFKRRYSAWSKQKLL